MPLDLMQNVNRTRSRDFKKFYTEQKKKMITRKPVKTKAKYTGSLFARRNKRLAIREGALRKVSVIITYKKITNGQVKKYEINPLEFKYKQLKKGWKKVLYAEDKGEKKQIKNFVISNIQNVVLTDRKFSSRYPVKIV